MMKPWWTRQPDRILEEDRALLALREGDSPILTSHRWTRESDGEPRVRAHLIIGAGTFEIEVRFPAHYPEGCPSVRPVPYDRVVSSHQFKRTGILCLELGPDNWHPRYTAADMVRSAWRLIVGEIIATFEPFEIPSRHESNLAEQIRLGDGVLVRSDASDEQLRSAQDGTEFECVWPSRNLLRVFPVTFPTGSPLPDMVTAFRDEKRMTGLVISLAEGAPEQVPKDPGLFRDFIATFNGRSLGEKTTLVVLRWHHGRTRGFLQLPSRVRHLVDMPLVQSDGERVPRELSEAVSALKIGIVGLGSLGSKIAVSLARTGVTRFVLVDGDILQGGNVSRHAADFRDFGASKVDAVAEVIRDVLPTKAEIVSHAVNLATPTSPEYHARVIEELGGADILVDATANPEVFGLLAVIASDKMRPLVWGEVFGGGLGGLVASAHPEHSPCPRCIRAGFLAACNAWPSAPATQPSATYADGDTEPVVATDADVSFIASAVTNRVLDIACKELRQPAVVLVGLRKGWIFDSPIQSVPVHVRGDDWWCPRCWCAESVPDDGVAAAVEALFSSHTDAHDPFAA